MNQTERYLCFNLGKEEFGIPLLSVREVLAVPDVTPVPQTPAHFLGIMNLRGQVISVLDLRLKLAIKPLALEETAVIILDLGSFRLGIVVDQVNSVQEISEAELNQKPALETVKSSDYISGVYKKDQRLVLLLDIFKALSIEDRSVVSKSAKGA